ncbi:MAG: hypothetical protein LBH25_00760 [Fibromonadaceae bacterium]|jgi:hypothetical protein|nr:hypothetical protein [Fibromonadaceae bacterium]
MEYKELDDPVEEVYRIRENILKEFNYDIKAYNAYLDKKRPKWEAMGFKFVSEAEAEAMRNRR